MGIFAWVDIFDMKEAERGRDCEHIVIMHEYGGICRRPIIVACSFSLATTSASCWCSSYLQSG
jgi:hypothetical protein